MTNRLARPVGPPAPDVYNETGDSVANTVRTKFPDARIVKVNPITGFVTVDLSKASGRTKRMIRNGDGYSVYDDLGPTNHIVELQVNVPQGKSKGRK